MKKLSYIFSFLLLFIIYEAKAQQPSPKLKVTGKVISTETLKPLANASVTIKGTKKGVVADSSGNFTIRVDKGQTIVVGYTSFEPQEFRITEPKNIDVQLIVRSIESDEVVVVGYGTRKKSHLTGSISKLVTDEYIGQIPVSRADQALQGKLAGVNITTTDAQAGAAPTIQIRGATSITAGTEPLIVIDGYPVPTDLSAIDMNDVESIEVLKDAASAAIYGSRGGNGVILITTKSGKIGKGKFALNVSRGVKGVYRKLTFPNLKEWNAKVKAENGGVLPASGELALAEKFDANTDAQDFIFRNVNYTNLQVAASGGTPTFKYYLSGSMVLDDGVMIGNDYKKFGLRAGFNAKVNPKTTIDFSFTPSYTEFYNVPVTVQEALRTLSPWTPAYHTDSTSKYTGMPVGRVVGQRDFTIRFNKNYTGPVALNNATSNSPISQLNGTVDKRTQIRNITSFSVRHEISKYFSIKSTLGFLFSEDTRSLKQKSWAQADPLLDGEAYARSTSKAILTKNRTLDVSNENTINYKRAIKKNDIDVVAGFSEQYTQLSYFSGQAGNFSSDENLNLNAGIMQALSDTVGERALVSALFRFNYAYDNKYLFSVSARTDGSSRFAPAHRWGFFPAASAGWRISNEKFYPENKIVNDLKLRVSYGTTGNENIGNYRYIAKVDPSYVVLGEYVTPATQLRSFGNENLEWERTFSTNFGVDMGILNNKIRLSVEYYNTKTDKLLLDLPIAASTGFTTYATNKGKVQNTGFEVEVSSTLISKTKFKWSVSANCYTNNNKLLDFDGSQQQINQGDPKRANFFLTQIGQPLVQYYGYISTKRVPLLNTNYWPVAVNSLHTFVQDQNKDGMITDADRIVLGNPYPKFNWGFTSNFQYKQFDLSLTIQGSHGAKVFNIDPYYFETQFSTTGSQAYKDQGYTPAEEASLQLNTQTDILIEDASFIALRNLNIGYSLPSKTAKKWGLSKLRLYVTTANLWYHFASGYSSYNPEADNAFPNDPLRKGYQRGAVPISRNITFGMNLDF
jgi:TonB-dependent starch-binding outer membrane protein SusC